VGAFLCLKGVEMSARKPNEIDIKRVQKALAYVTAYDTGIQDEDFDVFTQLLADETDNKGMVQALAQFSWMLLSSLDECGPTKEDVLRWYGLKFANALEEMRK